MNEIKKEQSLQEIADKGEALYEAVKDKYEPEYKGRYLAIEVESGNFYMGDNSMTAGEKAHAANPGKQIYLKKIGFTAADILATSFMSRP